MTFLKPKYHQLTDEELMHRSSKGNKNAFKVLYQRYHKKMFRYFYRMLGQVEEVANDFTQDLFLKIIEKGHYFDCKQKFSKWIYALAGNMVKNEYRRRTRHGITETFDEKMQNGVFDMDFERFDRPKFSKALKNAILQLDEKHRSCYVLRFQEELSIKEIAEILDCPEGTVKSRLYYALKKVVETMKKQLLYF